ncbi:unnamed protein product [Ranitomeya imitator]|uniref:Helix-turn-helix domain-containing protein n=1 Tax=Ranitomeya imitator TaxID=111125 RepID=A0ABN9MD94_9NEOB|nr:unnamed protein product [Ranitomeya imitator]
MVEGGPSLSNQRKKDTLEERMSDLKGQNDKAIQGKQEKKVNWMSQTGNWVELLDFIKFLNTNQLNIKLTCHFDTNSVDFLDITIKRDNFGMLQTDLFRKKTAVNSVLHASSSHPKHVINAIPIGQFLRLRRVCSSFEDFKMRAEEMKKRFLDRGTNNLIFSTSKPQKEVKTRFITEYHSHWELMREILSKHWSILTSDPVLKQYVPERPCVTARRARNLKDHLTKSFYPVNDQSLLFPSLVSKPIEKWGCAPCGNCVACPNIDCATSFVGSDSKPYKITQTITCNTKAVIYHATCPCSKIYVGLTTRPLKLRVREHVRDIRAAEKGETVEHLKTLPRHFKIHHGCDPTGLRVIGIDRIITDLRGGSVSRRLAQKESRWIWTLRTLQPLGLNEALNYSSFL